MLLDARYTDRDVRESENLYLLAVRFLKAYRGDFEFLVRARNHLDDTGALPIATARGVLNCMRSDPMAAMLLPQTPTGRYLDDVPHSGSGDDFYHRRQAANGHKRRPAHIDLPSKWHVMYVLSTWPTAQVYHVLRPELSHIRWYPHQSQFGYDIQLWCGYPFGWSYSSKYIMTNDQRGRRICRGCERRMQAYA
jgi:hypothetical protein